MFGSLTWLGLAIDRVFRVRTTVRLGPGPVARRRGARRVVWSASGCTAVMQRVADTPVAGQQAMIELQVHPCPPPGLRRKKVPRTGGLEWGG